MTPQQILTEAARRNITLAPDGEWLAITYPGPSIPPDMEPVLRAHKPALLKYLRAAVHLAKQILAGEFDGANRSTVEALHIGLRAIHHPLCQRALEHLHQHREP